MEAIKIVQPTFRHITELGLCSRPNRTSRHLGGVRATKASYSTLELAENTPRS